MQLRGLVGWEEAACQQKGASWSPQGEGENHFLPGPSMGWHHTVSLIYRRRRIHAERIWDLSPKDGHPRSATSQVWSTGSFTDTLWASVSPSVKGLLVKPASRGCCDNQTMGKSFAHCVHLLLAFFFFFEETFMRKSLTQIKNTQSSFLIKLRKKNTFVFALIACDSNKCFYSQKVRGIFLHYFFASAYGHNYINIKILILKRKLKNSSSPTQ